MVTGPTGPTGPTGDTGQVGTVVGYFGATRTPAELPSNGVIPINWDGPGRPPAQLVMDIGMYLVYQPPGGVGTAGWGDLWGFFPITVGVSGTWSNLGNITGPIGPTGPPGEDGIIGVDGATGPPGPVAVSVEAGNAAKLSSVDGLIFVNEVTIGPTGATGAELWVNPLAAGKAVEGYVDLDYVNELVTVSRMPPASSPSRTGLIWMVPRALSGFPITRTFVSFDGDWVEL